MILNTNGRMTVEAYKQVELILANAKDEGLNAVFIHPRTVVAVVKLIPEGKRSGVAKTLYKGCEKQAEDPARDSRPNPCVLINTCDVETIAKEAKPFVKDAPIVKTD